MRREGDCARGDGARRDDDRGDARRARRAARRAPAALGADPPAVAEPVDAGRFLRRWSGGTPSGVDVARRSGWVPAWPGPASGAPVPAPGPAASPSAADPVEALGVPPRGWPSSPNASGRCSVLAAPGAPRSGVRAPPAAAPPPGVSPVVAPGAVSVSAVPAPGRQGKLTSPTAAAIRNPYGFPSSLSVSARARHGDSAGCHRVAAGPVAAPPPRPRRPFSRVGGGPRFGPPRPPFLPPVARVLRRGPLACAWPATPAARRPAFPVAAPRPLGPGLPPRRRTDAPLAGGRPSCPAPDSCPTHARPTFRVLAVADPPRDPCTAACRPVDGSWSRPRAGRPRPARAPPAPPDWVCRAWAPPRWPRPLEPGASPGLGIGGVLHSESPIRFGPGPTPFGPGPIPFGPGPFWAWPNFGCPPPSPAFRHKSDPSRSDSCRTAVLILPVMFHASLYRFISCSRLSVFNGVGPRPRPAPPVATNEGKTSTFNRGTKPVRTKMKDPRGRPKERSRTAITLGGRVPRGTPRLR